MASVEGSASDVSQARDHEVPLWRLYLIRAVPILAIPWGFGLVGELLAPQPMERGMVDALLVGLWLMSLLAIRYPLQMIPLFLFEFVWKSVWLLAFGLPQWLGSQAASPRLGADLMEIGLGPIVFGLIIPWGYVWRHYVKQPSERWR